MSEKLTLGVVGDVTAFHREPESGYAFVGSYLQELDIVFAQNERLYTTSEDIIPAVGWTEVTRPESSPPLVYPSSSRGAACHPRRSAAPSSPSRD
ncbi:hypothetical protein ACWCSH_28910, partial [Streptosporangium sp. NPDC001682]